MATLVRVHGVLKRADGVGQFPAVVVFIPTIGAWYDSTADTTIIGTPVAACTQWDGSFSITLQATDDTGITPHTGWSYTVKEIVHGVLPHIWTGLAVPAADIATGLDYATVRQ